MYRFAGVRQKTNVRVQFESTQEECCVPICGPGTCGTLEPEKQVTTVEMQAADQCCIPVCGPETCG